MYSAWDGSQDIPDFSANEILDQLSDDLLRAGDPRRALRNLLQRGFTLPDGRRFDGLRRLIQQMQRERQSMLDRFDPSRTIDAIREQLEQIIATERKAIEAKRGDASTPTEPDEREPRTSRNDEPKGSADPLEAGPPAPSTGDPTAPSTGAPTGGDNQVSSASEGAGPSEDQARLQAMLDRMMDRKAGQLDRLPPDNAGRINGLREYDFVSAEAREAFDRLIGEMQRRLLQQYGQSLTDGVGQLTSEDLAGVRQMVQDLNQMIEASREGDREAFDRFMKQWATTSQAI